MRIRAAVPVWMASCYQSITQHLGLQTTQNCGRDVISLVVVGMAGNSSGGECGTFFLPLLEQNLHGISHVSYWRDEYHSGEDCGQFNKISSEMQPQSSHRQGRAPFSLINAPFEPPLFQPMTC